MASVYNSWDHSSGAASMPYLISMVMNQALKIHLLYYPCRVNNPTMNAGGVGGKVEIHNWNGDLLMVI